MSLDRLKWATIVLPIAFVLGVQATAMLVLMRGLGLAYGHVVAVAVVAVGVVLFSIAVFRIVRGLQQGIVQQNEELSALNAVARSLSGPLDLREALTRALANVMAVTGATAGEITVAGKEPDREPMRLSDGATEELNLLDALWITDAGHRDGSPSAEGVRIVDLEQMREPAATDAYDRGFRTAAWIPLKAQEELLGEMKLLAGERSRLACEGSERLLATVAGQIAVAIQASQLFSDVLHRGREAQALYEIALEIASLQVIETILRSIVERAREMLGSETAALCRPQGSSGELTLTASSGPADAFQGSAAQSTPVHTTLHAAARCSLGAEAAAPCSILTEEYCVSHLSVPLLVGASVTGALCVSSRTPQCFSECHRDLLATLANMAAIAINNARLLEGERSLAVLEERDRVAREMHDSLAQVLGYLHLKAQAAQRSLSRQGVVGAGADLDEVASLAHEAYVDVREAILGLRHTESPGVGMIVVLREYLRRFSGQSGIKVELDVDETVMPEFAPEVEVQLIRVIQEALTNVRKHANADTAWVRVCRQDADLSVCIEDNGNGFEPALIHASADHRFGVRIMRERIEKVGGRFGIESSPGRGTRVQICLPLGDREE